MEPTEYALQDILEELNITSLDDSDIETGLQEISGIEIESGASGLEATSIAGDSAVPSDLQPEERLTSLHQETSTDSGLSAEVRAALATVDTDEPTATADASSIAALEASLRLRVPHFPGSFPAIRVSRTSSGGIADSQPLVQAIAELTQEQASQSDAIAALRHESDTRDALRESFRSVANRPMRPQQVLPLDPSEQVRTVDARTAASLATGGFRLHMSDLTISEAVYQALRGKPEDELNVREWVQLRFYEARSAHKAEAERLRLEVEALRENACSAQTRCDRADRQLARREAAVTDLTQELGRQQQQSREQLEETHAKLRCAEHRASGLTDKGQRFDEVSRERERLHEEVQSLREAIAAQSAAQQQQQRDLIEASERVQGLDGECRLTRKDAESHERRARLLEEQLARREDDVTELKAKVESLREKKRELARKAATEQTSTAQEVRDQVTREIQRFQAQAQADLEAVRTNLTSLHEKEVSMLLERAEAGDVRIAELQRRLEDEEHKYQGLQISAARVKAELQNEITELTGSLKLRAFEVERAALTHEEVSSSRQQLLEENEQLRQQVEVLRKEYYNLEVQHREGRAAERAELTSVREQLQSYVQMERELDAAIRACAQGPTVNDAVKGGKALQSVDEALLIGTTLISAPTSAQRRIQQSLLLAQELQRRGREAVEAHQQLEEARAEVAQLREGLETARRDAHYNSEPQAYLLEALRRREGEVLGLRRDLKGRDAELQQCRQQLERAVAKRAEVETDIHNLLARRQTLDGLHALVAGKVGGGSSPPSEAGNADAECFVPPRAEHRGRAPNQQPQQAPLRTVVAGGSQVEEGLEASGAVGPAWLHRLRAKLQKPAAEGGDWQLVAGTAEVSKALV
eukprot:CAMPEP_0172871400 /NCGR_PEP_ID=MMETSP1075-20121228/92057_1 /TAXON_ID=2916 /ORGANISM="Ceratium fusus, Strain PA161109" /LENGTH=873 /DNA_ID=CAMNT_0013721629 /DNA_START=74 /DNA_END=2691 /DNA_ORIENTATION=-